MVNQLSLTTDEIKFARAVILAYMGFCLEINDGKGLPATFISGLRTHSRVALYDAPQKLAPYFNKMLAALSKTKALRAAGKVPDGGLKLESNGLKFSFAKDTSMYTTDATKDVIEALKSDGEFALAESQLKKRAAPAASPTPVRQRTDAGEPQAPAAAAMNEAPRRGSRQLADRGQRKVRTAAHGVEGKWDSVGTREWCLLLKVSWIAASWQIQLVAFGVTPFDCDVGSGERRRRVGRRLLRLLLPVFRDSLLLRWSPPRLRNLCGSPPPCCSPDPLWARRRVTFAACRRAGRRRNPQARA